MVPNSDFILCERSKLQFLSYLNLHFGSGYIFLFISEELYKLVCYIFKLKFQQHCVSYFSVWVNIALLYALWYEIQHVFINSLSTDEVIKLHRTL